jgi:hypothetical protein
LTYATFLGGSGDLDSSGIALDDSGSAYVTGSTGSSSFPATPGAFDTSYNGGWDAFVAKLNPAGSGLAYATFLGGNASDSGNGIAVDAADSAYLTGSTWSSDFPNTPGAFDTSHNGAGDVFVAKILVREPRRIYLPLVLSNAVIYYEGSWETEPNDTYLQANGPIRAGRDYYGYPNDARDYWSFYAAGSGSMQVDLTNHTGQGVQLQLFYQSPMGGPVAIVTSAPYHLDYNGAAGWYYVYIYTAGGYNQTTPYTVRVSYPF